MLTPELNTLLTRIDTGKKRIDEYRPFPPELAHHLQNYYRIDLTYTSNAIEGNTLTLSETKVILEDGLTIGGKTLREHLEVLGGAQAYNLMLKLAQNSPFKLTEQIILNLHRNLYHAIDPKKAGKYRKVRVYITGTTYIPPAPTEVPELMRNFVRKLNEVSSTLHPMELASFAHLKLVEIHPFVDGNGRTARLLMNLILLNKGYHIISIPPIRRSEYIQALRIAQSYENPSDTSFNKLIFECEIEEQKSIARMLGIDLKKYH